MATARITPILWSNDMVICRRMDIVGALAQTDADYSIIHNNSYCAFLCPSP